MNNYPEYVEVKGKKYKINTDFRVAIECNRIALDEKIGELERALGIICTLFGEDALNDKENYESLLKLAQKYLTCGKEIKNINNEDPDMDFIEDMDYIEASFMSDYNIDLSNIEMHWWKFYKLINGLSNSDIGNCCILNRVRNLRNFDASQIKDNKERQKIIEAKEMVTLKKNKKENHLTKEQEESMERLNKMLGL